MSEGINPQIRLTGSDIDGSVGLMSNTELRKELLTMRKTQKKTHEHMASLAERIKKLEKLIKKLIPED